MMVEEFKGERSERSCPRNRSPFSKHVEDLALRLAHCYERPDLPKVSASFAVAPYFPSDRQAGHT